MKILLITTCVCNAGNVRDLVRLIESCRSNSVGSGLFFKHLILLQNYIEDEYCIPQFNEECYSNELLFQPNVISLSKARNKMLLHAKENDYIVGSDIVSFPDDDCWYPSGFWKALSNKFLDLNLQLFYTRFSSSPEEFGSNSKNSHSFKRLVVNASSNTTFYKADVLESIGFLDELYGVGAPNNGGEDTDFAIRAALKCNSYSVYFYDKSLIGHRDPLPEFKYKYFVGSFGVLKKHSSSSPMVSFLMLRKFVVGLLYLCLGKVKIKDFIISK